MRQYFWLVLILGFVGFKGYGQGITVSAKLDKSTIFLGGQTVLRLNANLPVKSKIAFPNMVDTLSSKVRIVETGRLDTLKDKNDPSRWTLSRAYTITAFDSGVQIIPGLVFDTVGGQVKTEALPLQVEPVNVDTTKGVYDIKQPIAVSYGFMDWLKDHLLAVGLGILVTLLVISAGYYYFKTKKNAPVIAEVKPLVPAHILAMDKLLALRDKKLLQQEQVKLYHSELTDIIREFLEKKYEVNAMEQTSEEIFASLKPAVISKENRSRLKEVLTIADLVKFAKLKPSLVENERSMEDAISFVKDTQKDELI